ncbi:hypothetical protein [Paraglaciecola chathamensis]|jgi:hypothetical protein|uniref:Uncharacterized protein n=3 Tax=Paraglaciecola chathamensis TaxID=368405 RepID=A0ABS0WDD3_9ALTE|nr:MULTISPECIES: hypothetical protein [Paraglaciecola]AEE24950.1 hypothetical protein Glaag_4026 [Glaciecola sp. 4H-3-7+YE-5]MBJ2136494.1 hypothetical protein [Paraglaciecola chathamensis]MBU3019451.1 hypothetical protein [Paraglaciecola agarilytica]MDO6559858.1 hypothetical protein [Paraglaciecola chathamensis]MDO6839631.1 hypothetical protein [Paraglaciecola chathamensis]
MKTLKAIGNTLTKPATLLISTIFHKTSFWLLTCISLLVLATHNQSRARTKSQTSASH